MRAGGPKANLNAKYLDRDRLCPTGGDQGGPRPRKYQPAGKVAKCPGILT